MKQLMKKATKLVGIIALAAMFTLLVPTAVDAAGAKPTNVRQTYIKENSIAVSFDLPTGYNSYEMEVEYSTDGRTYTEPVDYSFWNYDYYGQYSCDSCVDIDGLTQGRKYYVRIRGYKSPSTYTDYSDPILVATTPGAITSALKQITAEEKSATISWGAAAGADGYAVGIYTADGSEIANYYYTTATSYKLTGLDSNNKVVIAVRPYVNVNKTEKYSYGISYYGNPENYCLVTTKATSVSDLKVIQWNAQAAKSPTFTWKINNAADGYELSIALNGGKTKKVDVPATYTNDEITAGLKQYTYTGIKKAGNIKVTIRPYVTVNGSKTYGSSSKAIYGVTQPKITRATINGSKLTIKWAKVTGATSYTVYASKSKYTKFKKVKEVKKNVTSYTLSKIGGSKIAPYNTYYIYVIANKKVGGKKYKSPASHYKEYYITRRYY